MIDVRSGTVPPLRRLRVLRCAAVLAVMSSIGVVAGGCDGDSDSDSDGSVNVGSVDEELLVTATDELVAACEDRDHARLRDLSSPGVHDRIRDQDNVFNPAVGSVMVIDREISIDGDAATVTVTLGVTIDGAAEEVDQTWTYDKVDGTWVLVSVPNCDFTES